MQKKQNKKKQNKKNNNKQQKPKRHIKKKNSTHENTVSITIEYAEAKKNNFFLQKNVCKVMPLRKVPNTEDNEKNGS